MLSDQFLATWHQAATTTLGLFWTAFWAFSFGYIISSMFQVFINHAKIQQTMDKDGSKSVLFGAVFGLLSSSCSFSALSKARAAPFLQKAPVSYLQWHFC
ncbi:permease [Marivita sp.]|uniref:permease n=1 Tax=Marivita sp. TaxID=2003365 RepID=UPI003B5272C5